MISDTYWIRAAIGGLLVGAMGFFMPEVLSEGYEITQSFLTNNIRPEIWFVLISENQFRIR